MSDLQEIIEKEFNQAIHKPYASDNQKLVKNLQEKVADLKETVAYYTPYKRKYDLLSEPLSDWLLSGRVKIEELPLEIRLSTEDYLHAYTYAWRYAEAKRDVDYGMAIIDLLQSDMTEQMLAGELDKETYGQWLKQWLDYLARGLSAFKESKVYDHYFLKHQKAHKDLFDEYLGDMEDHRDMVSLL